MAKTLEIRLPNNWKPRVYQNKLWEAFSSGYRYFLARWHRRAGKDDICLNHEACASHERVGNYWHMLPQYAQARKAIWEAVSPHTGKRRIDEAFPPELRETTREQEMLIKFKNGSTWQVVGSDNYNSLVGTTPAGIVMSEYALCNPASWGYFSPILMENNGWAAFISTPRGKNHFWALERAAKDDPEWFVDIRTSDDTTVFTEKQLSAELKRYQLQYGDAYGKSLWLQEYYCSYDAAQPGSIFAEWLDRGQKNGRVRHCPHNPAHKVHTAWDLGRVDATAIWFYQIIGREIIIINYHESNLQDVPFYGDLLRGDIKENDAIPLQGLKRRTKAYSYDTHWLPQDAKQRHMAAGGRSIHKQMIEQGVGRIVVIKQQTHINGIQAARKTFPFIVFDTNENVESGREVLRNYRYEWDEEKKKFIDHPVHDWSSHGSTAFITLSLSWKHPKTSDPDKPIEPLNKENSITKQSFGAMKKKHFKRMKGKRNSIF